MKTLDCVGIRQGVGKSVFQNHIESAKMNNPNSNISTRLSSHDLSTIQNAIKFRIKSLEELHWRGAAMGATDPFYRNIQLEIANNESAVRAVCRVFEAQFESRKDSQTNQ